MTTNPFEVLGIDPSLVVRLSPRQLDQVVAVLGRTLKAMYHPDQALGGDVERFREVNEACQQLNRNRNPAGFAEARRALKDKIKRSKIKKLSLEVEDLRIAQRKAQSAFLRYLAQFAGGESGSRVIADLTGSRLKMIDPVMIAQSPDRFWRESGFFYLEFTPQGIFRVSPRGRSRIVYARIPIGTVRTEDFKPHGQLRGFLAGGTVRSRRMIGNFRPSPKMTIRADGDIQEDAHFGNRHQLESMKNEVSAERMLLIMADLTQTISKDRVLFSMGVENDQRRFYADGIIIDVESPASF